MLDFKSRSEPRRNFNEDPNYACPIQVDDSPLSDRIRGKHSLVWCLRGWNHYSRYNSQDYNQTQVDEIKPL